MRRADDERGSVTAETAVALPALAVLLALSLWAVGAVTVQLRCVDAARVAARALARGESREASMAAAREAAPDGAIFSVRSSGDLVLVAVAAGTRLPGPWGGAAPLLRVGASAAATLEEAAVPE